jgi:hypothetical protein
VPTGNHLGDPCLVGGELWVPCDDWTGSTGTGDQFIRVRTSDLAVLGLVNVSGIGRPIAGIGYNPDDGYIWATDFTNGASLMRLTTAAGALHDTITLSIPLSNIEGVAFLNGLVYLSQNSGRVWEVKQDGTVRRVVFNPSAWIGEGLCTVGSNLLILNGSGTSSAVSLAWSADPTGAATDWLNLAAPSGIAQMGVFTGLTKLTQWSMGAHAMLTAKSINRAALSYYDSTGSSNTTRETFAYHSATDRWGMWNSTDSWLDNTSSPATNTVYRLNATHDGTTARKVYVNGTPFTDSAVAQRPSGTGDALYIGSSDSAGNDEAAGRFNFAYIRSGILSDNWIAAEASNWLTPSGFYSVGSEQAA